MKKLILALTMIPMMAQAKVADFNALINENSDAQSQLHKDVKSNVEETRAALRDDGDKLIVVGNDRGDVNVPTDKNFMRFQKEVVDHRPSNKVMEKRLANEFKSLDMEF